LDPDGCYIDLESTSYSYFPFSSILCDASRNVIGIRASLKDNSLNIDSKYGGFAGMLSTLSKI
jgi:hypothetical protein